MHVLVILANGQRTILGWRVWAFLFLRPVCSSTRSTIHYGGEASARRARPQPDRRFLIGDAYNIADIATYSWYGNLVLHNQYEAAEFLDVNGYQNVIRWATEIDKRPAVQRGRRVNRIRGPEGLRLAERHNASDLD